MKSISSDLQDHLEQEVTTLCTCWHLTRRDGEEFFFTDLDRDIEVDGDTYVAASGYSRTAIENDSTMAVDNLDIQGFLDDDSITETDLRAGLFDYAEIRIFTVNYEDLSQGILKQRRGHLGEVVLTDVGIFRAELRGLTQVLSQRVGELYSPECRADLGDTRCKIPIAPALRVPATLYAVGDFIRVATDLLASGQAQYENRIYECTTAGYTAALGFEPTYDTVVGNTTTEEGIRASGLLTFTGQPSNGQTFTVDGKVYTMQSVLTDVDGNILIGATTADTVANILAGVNLGAGAGVVYAASMTAHATVDFAQGVGNSITLTAKAGGSAGNAIGTTETLSNASFGATTLTGGLDGAVFTAREAWSRHAEILTVTSNSSFTIDVDESRANVDSWFTGGVVIFETGDNAGHVIEIRSWVAATNTVTVFLPLPFAPQVGDTLRLYPGCDKTTSMCIARFNNILNFRGEPFVPGQDEILKYPNAK